MKATQEELPHWDLSNVYSGLGSDDFSQAMEEVKILNDELEKFLDLHNISRSNTKAVHNNPSKLAETVAEIINRINKAV